MVNVYVKKPISVLALLWTGYNFNEVRKFVGSACELHGSCHAPDLVIHTLEGDHHASVGDYIIRGVKGEFYPCKPDIFEQIYKIDPASNLMKQAADILAEHLYAPALNKILDDAKKDEMEEARRFPDPLLIKAGEPDEAIMREIKRKIEDGIKPSNPDWKVSMMRAFERRE